jgi:Response regulator of the LytR/AlgR family
MALYKIAICDDDSTFINLLKIKVKKYCKTFDLDIEIIEYNRGEELLEACIKNKFDLVLLDIEMPEISGINVASRLCSLGHSSEIIFISGFEDYVYESIKYKPFRFIRKKYINQELPEALKAFSVLVKNSFNNYLFSTKEGTIIWNINDILYMEVFQHYIYVHSSNSSIKVRGSLDKYEKEFQKWGFIRIHKSYLVSYKHIYSVNPTEVILMNRMKLPLSRRKNEEVKEKFINYTRGLE